MWIVNDKGKSIIISRDNYPLLPHIAKIINPSVVYEIFVEVANTEIAVGTAFRGTAHFHVY